MSTGLPDYRGTMDQELLAYVLVELRTIRKERQAMLKELKKVLVALEALRAELRGDKAAAEAKPTGQD